MPITAARFTRIYPTVGWKVATTPMSDADKYRANSRHCLRKAEKAAHPQDKQM
jgi:hypothetical protein